MPNLNLPICPSCHGTMRFTRRDSRFKCQYCDYICDSAVAKGLYPKPTAPAIEEPTINTDSPVFDMFKRQAQTITAAPAPVATVSVTMPAPAPAPAPATVKPIEQTIYPDLVDGITDTDVPDTDVPDTEVWTPSFNENAIDVNKIFSYHHGKDEKRTSPQRMAAMPSMQVSAQRAEAPTFDTGRNQYSLRSER